MTLPAYKLSATIITRNEEAQIGDCLESVRWADEIIVVDTGSVDRTLELCAKYTPHIYSRPWEGYATAKNAATTTAAESFAARTMAFMGCSVIALTRLAP